MPISEALMVALTGMIVVMAELGLLAAIMIAMSNLILAVTARRASEKTSFTDAFHSAPAAAAAPQETQSAGSLDLHDVDDKTAAMLMAIVSEESGIPLHELSFQSIQALD